MLRGTMFCLLIHLQVKRRMLSKSCPNIPSELDDSDLNPLNEKWKSMDIRRDLKKESFEDVSEMLDKDPNFLDMLYKRFMKKKRKTPALLIFFIPLHQRHGSCLLLI